MKQIIRIAGLALVLALLCMAALAEENTQYVGNDWGFVEESMDVSQGIPEKARGELGDIRARGLLRVATEPYYPPQEFIDPSLEGQAQYVGADMELARLIAERMGVELEIVPMDFTEVLPAVAEDVCDLAISGLAYTPARASAVTLSKGYHFSESSTGNGMVIRLENAETIRTLDDLTDKMIVAQSGSLQEALTAQNVFTYKEFRRLNSIQDVYDAVQRGEADAGTVDIETAQTYLRNNPNCGMVLASDIHFVLEPQFDGDRVAAKKGEIQLMYFVNGVIDELLADGRYEQWFSESEKYAERLGLY